MPNGDQRSFRTAPVGNIAAVQTQQQLRRAELLLSVTNRLADTPSLDEALETLVGITTHAVGAEHGSVFLHDRTTGELFSRTRQGGKWTENRFPVASGVAGDVFQTGRRRSSTTRAPTSVSIA